MHTITLSVPLRAELYQRAMEQTADRGESVETLLQELLEEYLEELDDRTEAEATLARIRSGEEPLMSWETFQTIEDPEERSDVLAVIAAKRAVDQGEDELIDWEPDDEADE